MGSSILEDHEISSTGKGYHLREDAREAVRFLASNNVLTGPLREVCDRLARKLALVSSK